MPAAFEIVPGSGVDIPALEPLWVAVHHRHAESMPELGPYVRAESRGAGIGSALLDALEAGLAERGVTDLVLGVLPGNDAAIRMYERRGYRPTWMYLSRFARGR
jgi:ribosomal protein S18 acetylase RimI-like enzyme